MSIRKIAIFLACWLFLLSHVFALSPNQKVLVIVDMNGFDWLQVIPPQNDEWKYTRRDRISETPSNLVGAANQPGWLGRDWMTDASDLKGLFDAGHVAIVQKVGFPTRPFRSSVAEKLLWSGAGDTNSSHYGQGFGQRLANIHLQGQSNWSILDISANTYVLENGSFAGARIRDINGIRSPYFKQHGLDTGERWQTKFDTHPNYSKASSLASALSLGAGASTELVWDIKGTSSGEPGGYPGYSLGYILRRAQYAIENFPSDVKVIVAKMSGFERSHSDQKDLYDSYVDDVARAIEEFHQNLTASGYMDKTILALVNSRGRTIAGQGPIPNDTNYNNGDERGTGNGWASDWVIVSDQSVINGGYHLAGYNNFELTQKAYVEPNIYTQDMLRYLLQAIGYNPDGVVDSAGSLGSLSVF